MAQPMLVGAEHTQITDFELRLTQDRLGWEAFDRLGRDNLAKLR